MEVEVLDPRLKYRTKSSAIQVINHVGDIYSCAKLHTCLLQKYAKKLRFAGLIFASHMNYEYQL